MLNKEELPEIDAYWYLASPYSKYKDGPEAAFKHVAQAAAYLMKKKIPVFCPITHSHPISIYGNTPLNDPDFWLNADWPMFDAAGGVIILMMDGWEESYGVAEEIKRANAQGKFVEFMEWVD